MIPESVFSPQTRDWKSCLAESFRRIEDLLAYCDIEAADLALCPEPDFPLRVTRYYADLIEKGNADDPLLLQVLPQAREMQQVDGYQQDAVGDLQAMPVPGLIHKYHGRVLLPLTGACAIHCRYCFRRHFPYRDAMTNGALPEVMMQYLSSHRELREVILSGGDPLMLSDEKLGGLVQSLNQIPHIQLLRIHSRLLSVLPQRITDDLLDRLEEFHGQLVFVTHINHPQEIDPVNQAAFNRIHQRGLQLLNQTVLLRQVNDQADTLVSLSYKLFNSHILPYYLHTLDKVEGSAHFDLSSAETCQLYREIRNELPGYLLPRLVSDIPGNLAKTPMHCG